MADPSVEPPKWFKKNLTVQCQFKRATVRNCSIHYSVWGDSSRPGLVLVHGGLAHWHWWQMLAPFWTERYCVIALDLSGHGSSEWRDGYDAEIWAEEIVTAMEVADVKGPSVVVGHSLGGLLSLTAAAKHPRRFKGLIIVDSPVLNFEQSKGEGRRGNSYLHVLPYPNLELAKKRFRLVPAQPIGEPGIVDFLAEKSLKQVSEGWIWKFDPSVFVGVKRPEWIDLFPQVLCPTAFIRGVHSSIATPEMCEALTLRFPNRLAMVDIPEAHHHLMVDQPLALVASINALLATWEIA